MIPQGAVSGKSLLVAVAIGAAPALASLYFLRNPLAQSDIFVAGAALAVAAVLAWSLRRRLPEIPQGWMLGLALLVAAVPTVIASLRLESTITNDERAYLYQAELFAGGHLAEPLPPDPEMFVRRQLYHDEARGIRYAKYPPGTALGLLPGVMTGWPMLSTLLAGLADVLLLAAIARRLRLVLPALAALLLALSPFFLLVQTSVQSEVFSLPFVLAGYWALLKVRDAGTSSRASVGLGALAGACTGFVFLCRPLTGLLLALALGLGFMSSPRRVHAALGAVLCGLPFALVFLLYNRALTGDAFTIPYHLYALRYGPFNPDGKPIDIYGSGDVLQGLIDQAGRWSVAFAGILGTAALGFWGLWRMRARDGGAALCFALLGPAAYSLHWYQGHRVYLGPLHCHEALGFLVCGALIVLQAAPERVRRACVLAAVCAGPVVFAFHFDALRELSDLRSAPQRAARNAPSSAVILYVMGASNMQDEFSIKYYSPSLPSWQPNEQVFVREPHGQPLQQALRQCGLSGRPVYRWVPDPNLRSGHLEPVPQP